MTWQPRVRPLRTRSRAARPAGRALPRRCSGAPRRWAAAIPPCPIGRARCGSLAPASYQRSPRCRPGPPRAPRRAGATAACPGAPSARERRDPQTRAFSRVVPPQPFEPVVLQLYGQQADAAARETSSARVSTLHGLLSARSSDGVSAVLVQSTGRKITCSTFMNGDSRFSIGICPWFFWSRL